MGRVKLYEYNVYNTEYMNHTNCDKVYTFAHQALSSHNLNLIITQSYFFGCIHLYIHYLIKSYINNKYTYLNNVGIWFF